MVIAVKKAENRADVDEVTEKTVSVVKACVCPPLSRHRFPPRRPVGRHGRVPMRFMAESTKIA